jgi:hypothetical protein
MSCTERQEEQFISRLQRMLPLTAHGRPPLLAFLRKNMSIERTSPRLTVTNVFYAGEQRGLMCHFVVSDATEMKKVFVAPIEQLAFERRQPITQEIPAHRKRRLNPLRCF